ncbi:RidA family protein [Nitratireductor sp. ZSWI3]|uniref:RidA family protein n=1 Tax=Nitratireductor sp. ZSWI3 TaxID=2966359 RepID=UPI00214FC422|nr:RidA family protein [Nitratireductor sp. ZSWI3]MCR4268368.1 RidA family protein [Nitratireductor sp. ZSWI3]
MIRLASLLTGAVLLAGAAQADPVVRHKIPGSDFPIARAVEVPDDATTIYLSGAVPAVVNENAERGTLKAYGDMTEQTRTVLQAIEKTLKEMDLGIGDIVKLQVFLVAKDGEAMDFAGFMKGYTEFFGTEAQPNLPARSVFQVAGLANPGWLIEIEAIAVREDKD